MMDTVKKMASNPYLLVGGGFALGVLAGYMMFKPKAASGSGAAQQ